MRHRNYLGLVPDPYNRMHELPRALCTALLSGSAGERHLAYVHVDRRM